MALKYRDRVGRAFEALAAGLEPFLDRRMQAATKTGADWLQAWKAQADPPIRGPVSPADPALQLRIIADTWNAVFRDEFTKTERNLVFELRDTRNRWAHNDAFSLDDTYRSLDSVERLLIAIDATQAAEVGRSKDELMRERYEAQARRAAPAPEVLATQPAAGLKPWREVIQPHDDVARGRYSEPAR